MKKRSRLPIIVEAETLSPQTYPAVLLVLLGLLGTLCFGAGLRSLTRRLLRLELVVQSAEIAAPALTVLLVESTTVGTNDSLDAVIPTLGKKSFTPDPGVVWEMPDFRHSGHANYLFLDGHVKTLQGPNPRFPGYKTDADGVALCSIFDPLPQ